MLSLICPDVFRELNQFFQNFDMVLETHLKLCKKKPDFFYFKIVQNGPKIWFLVILFSEFVL